jgi:hypothetical protein
MFLIPLSNDIVNVERERLIVDDLSILLGSLNRCAIRFGTCDYLPMSISVFDKNLSSY